jgi:hypothetical protein
MRMKLRDLIVIVGLAAAGGCGAEGPAPLPKAEPPPARPAAGPARESVGRVALVRKQLIEVNRQLTAEFGKIDGDNSDPQAAYDAVVGGALRNKQRDLEKEHSRAMNDELRSVLLGGAGPDMALFDDYTASDDALWKERLRVVRLLEARRTTPADPKPTDSRRNR